MRADETTGDFDGWVAGSMRRSVGPVTVLLPVPARPNDDRRLGCSHALAPGQITSYTQLISGAETIRRAFYRQKIVRLLGVDHELDAHQPNDRTSRLSSREFLNLLLFFF